MSDSRKARGAPSATIPAVIGDGLKPLTTRWTPSENSQSAIGSAASPDQAEVRSLTPNIGAMRDASSRGAPTKPRAITLLARRRSALLWGAVAGFGMVIWIFVEMAIIETYSWLHSLYFGLGSLELILVLPLLGIAPALVSPAPRVQPSRQACS